MTDREEERAEVASVNDRPGYAKTSRKTGDCDHCDVKGVQVIKAIDERIYSGWACPDCVLSGKISDFAPEHGAMVPMVFIARALKGDEPYASLMAAADAQREDPIQAARAAQSVREKLADLRVDVANRKARRRAAAISRKGES